MKRLNDLNWQWFVCWFALNYLDVEVKPLGDFECIQICNAVLETCKYLNGPKLLYLEAIKVKSNLYSMVVTNSQNQYKVLRQADSNDHKIRKRPDINFKSNAIILYTNQNKQHFAS